MSIEQFEEWFQNQFPRVIRPQTAPVLKKDERKEEEKPDSAVPRPGAYKQLIRPMTTRWNLSNNYHIDLLIVCVKKTTRVGLWGGWLWMGEAEGRGVWVGEAEVRGVIVGGVWVGKA